MDTPDIQLVEPAASDETLLDAAREILREYAEGLDIDLCFQSFDEELAQLPGDYAAPDGALLLALVDGQVAGCGAFRALADVDYTNACEMKRLYVRRAFRGFGIGRIVAQALLERAV